MTIKQGKILTEAKKQLQGYEVVAWQGYKQKNVTVVLEKNGKKTTKEFAFSTKELQGQFTKHVRRLYYGSG